MCGLKELAGVVFINPARCMCVCMYVGCTEHTPGYPALAWRLKVFCFLEKKKGQNKLLRCFNTVFQRPYRYFSIALKVVFTLSDRYKIFTSYWLWIEICENVVLSKIDITMTTINKKL